MVYFGKNDYDSTDEESGFGENDVFRRKAESHIATRNNVEENTFLIEFSDKTKHSRIKATESWKGTWLCRPYKRERLLEEIYAANRKGASGHAAVLNTLKNAGIMIFIVDSKVSMTTAEILDSVHNVVRHITKEERCPAVFSRVTPERCLLYRDDEGRFFNLTFDDYSTSFAHQWNDNMRSFSVLQAMGALMVLSRSFACVAQIDTGLDALQPIYFAAMLGLVLKEEISLSWTNVAMSVRGLPSISASSSITGVESDYPRKMILFALIMASVTEGIAQHILLMAGIGLACCVLLANLGSRVWGFLAWQPIGNFGFFEPIVAFVLAIITGLCFPLLGQRQMEAGGKASVESVVGPGFLVALLFIISDYDTIQKYLVLGSSGCNQDIVNLTVGIWWTVTTMVSIWAISMKEHEGVWPEDEEPLLQKDHASPVGFKVPNLPEFPIHSLMGKCGLPCISGHTQVYGSLILSALLGCFICFLAFTDIDDNLDETIRNNIFSET